MEAQISQSSAIRNPKVISSVVALLALLVAVVGSLLTGTRMATVTGGMESLVATFSSFMNRAADVIPLGYAFGAGMVATVNPCGFAMLPAYRGLYLGTDEGEGTESSVERRPSSRSGQRVGQALLVSLLVTAGFVLLFGAAGLLISAGVRAVITVFPWLGLGVGGLLVVAGAWLLGGGNLHTTLGDRLATRVGNPNQSSAQGYFLFGISYGLSSLSCTLPVFLTVVGGTVAAGGFLNASFQFVMYALGMGFVILLLTLGMAVFKEALIGKLRRGLRYVQTVSAVLLMLAGAYIVYYWLTLGGLLETFVST